MRSELIHKNIGVWIGEIKGDPQSGGGFTFIDSIVKELTIFEADGFDITIFYTGKSPHPVTPNLKWIRLNKNFITRLNNFFVRQLARYKINIKLINKIFISQLEKACLKANISLIWFPSPTFLPVKKIPYIFTVWDVGHRTVPWFPEVFAEGELERRDFMYHHMLNRAMRIITGNQTGKNELIELFNINSDLIVIIPFVTNSLSVEPKVVNEIAKLHHPFVFYPAQFWPHKNHITALKMIKCLNYQHKINISIVFTGSDKGNINYVKKIAKELAIEDFVHFLGFVDQSELVWLYKNSLALTYFSALGPNNLPPLESILLGCPVIVSNLKGHVEQLGSHVLYANVFDHIDWSKQVKLLVDNPEKRNEMSKNGVSFVEKLTYHNYLIRVFNVINDCCVIRDLWE
jgi:glycosyltransferase involved in cell wall biosynthesis